MEQLRLEWRRASELTENPRNWRRHPKAQTVALESVMREVGWAGALLYNEATGRLIDGHLRREMAGDDEVPVLVGSWTEEQERLILATFDPIAALAEADKDNLGELLRSIQSEDEQIRALLETIARQEHVPLFKDGLTDPDDVPPEPTEVYIQRGDVWLLGEHRLMCGDSTNAEDVGRLMGITKAVLFATDPPYGIDYDSARLHRNETHYDAIEMDNLKDDVYQRWLEACFSCWVPYLTDNCAWFLWHPMLTQGYFAAAAAAAGIMISRQIIWVKPQFIFGRGEYHWQHELCFYGWQKGSRPPFYGERNQATIWEVGYEGSRNEREHPTQKPVELFSIPIQNHTQSREVIAEPFCGSGSQIIAAERTGRWCYAMEIEPRYVQVSLERWQNYTGKKAVKDG